MIVRDRLHGWQLLFIMRGSVIRQIAGTLVGFGIYSLAIIMLDRWVFAMPRLSLLMMGTLGASLSLFLSFRNAAAYERWWEARKLWGVILVEARSFSRELMLYLGEGADRARLLEHTVAFAHFHRAMLRRISGEVEAAAWIGPEAAARFAAAPNPGEAVLNHITAELRRLAQEGRLDTIGLSAIGQRLETLSQVSGGCERIMATPMPLVYSLLMRRTIWLYCLILPFALLGTLNGVTSDFWPIYEVMVAYTLFGFATVTEELEHPFTSLVHGIPLDAICRNIEISLCTALGRVPPEPLRPSDHLLT
ncbi:hypothetical protein FGG78_28030 [Thioclava sp. BHET1]|nr:hypothetical protein FGG78_28030 [Thioclava sp. BHET1]